jgi:hypothetical protein
MRNIFLPSSYLKNNLSMERMVQKQAVSGPVEEGRRHGIRDFQHHKGSKLVLKSHCYFTLLLTSVGFFRASALA